MSSGHPAYLDPSELGTREYWDSYYAKEWQDTTIRSDTSTLSSWFSDVKAPRRILDFLLSPRFPLSPNYIGENPKAVSYDRPMKDKPSVLDVGTGNGRMLFELRNGKMEDSDSESGGEPDAEETSGYQGPLYGIDYSAPSIDLARAVCATGSAYMNVSFYTMDVLTDNPESMKWWPRSDGGGALKLFDLILDKGTFDAISLSHIEPDTQAPHPSSIYPTRVVNLLSAGGFLLVTSCNWTEDELIDWFAPHSRAETVGSTSESHRVHEKNTTPALDVYDIIKYPTFKFGGKEGAGVASVCFRRIN